MATAQQQLTAVRIPLVDLVHEWMTTVDHKRIGILYLGTTFVFFLIGGIEALLMRFQLAWPQMNLLNPIGYNQLFTMHGVTMVFFGDYSLNATKP